MEQDKLPEAFIRRLVITGMVYGRPAVLTRREKVVVALVLLACVVSLAAGVAVGVDGGF